MKKVIKILLVVLLLLIVFAGTATFMHHDEDYEVLDEYTEIIGRNYNGTVYKITCGNNSSNDTAIVILGVHSLEGGIHNATNKTIMNFTKNNNLSKKYIVYFIKINYKDSGRNTSDYDTNRLMGERLANQYVVPDIAKYDPYIIVDVHEMESYWEAQRYVGVLNNDSDIEREYASKISNYLDYPIYAINSGTSPKWVTIPLSKTNHTVILFETAQKDSQSKKMQTANDLVRIIDSLPVYEH